MHQGICEAACLTAVSVRGNDEKHSDSGEKINGLQRFDSLVLEVYGEWRGKNPETIQHMFTDKYLERFWIAISKNRKIIMLGQVCMCTDGWGWRW